MSDIDQLSDRELDAVVHNAFVGWRVTLSQEETQIALDHEIIPRYSTDANAVREIEAEINRRWLVVEYTNALGDLVGQGKKTILKEHIPFLLATAHPRQRCIAALKAIGYQMPPGLVENQIEERASKYPQNWILITDEMKGAPGSAGVRAYMLLTREGYITGGFLGAGLAHRLVSGRVRPRNFGVRCREVVATWLLNSRASSKP